MVTVLLRTLNGRTVCLNNFNFSFNPNFDEDHLLVAASQAEGIPTQELRVRVQKGSGNSCSGVVQAEVLMRLKGGKQGAFGQTLKHTKMIRKTTNFDSCRTLDGRRIRDVRQEERLRQWQAAKAKRELERAEEAERAREEKRRAVQERVDDLIERVERDSVSTMVDAVREGLALAREERKRKANEVHDSGLKKEQPPPPPLKARKIGWDDEELLLGLGGDDEEEEEESIFRAKEYNKSKNEDKDKKEEEDEDEEEEEEEEETEEFKRTRKEVIKRKHEHDMTKTKNPYGLECLWECDGCGKKGTTEVMHCCKCNYDLCQDCYTYSTNL